MSSDVIKIGFVVSIAFSFPLVIFPCRASLFSLLHRHGHSEPNAYIPEEKFRAYTAGIGVGSLLVALVIPSVELVIGLVGSTIGIAICIVFPACCFTTVSKKDSTEKLLAKFLIVGGFCLMVLGTYANLSAIDEKATAVHVPESLVPNVLEFGDGDLAKVEYHVGQNADLVNEELDAKKLLGEANAKEGNAEGEPQVGADQKVLSNDAIKKEEEEELTDKDQKVVVQEQLNKVVDEIKRQNEESQKKVLEKLEQIVEKIELLDSEARPLDQNVLDQVRDKFPDPIPLRSADAGPGPEKAANAAEKEEDDVVLKNQPIRGAAQKEGVYETLGKEEGESKKVQNETDNKEGEESDAMRRDLLNVDIESLNRVKRSLDCEREI